jgi:hypothetical protein
MKIKRAVYNLLLFALFIPIGLGICRAEPKVNLKWSIDLKNLMVKYAVTNKDTAVIKWSDLVTVSCRPDSDKNSIIHTFATTLASDGVIHPFIEIIYRPDNKTRVETFGGFMSLFTEIKPGETREFSSSLADAVFFSDGPADLNQIESASLQLALGGKIIYSTSLDYRSGKWKPTAR